jgi:threonyl-tRNA synthetase
LGRRYDLFSLQEAAGGGLVFWHPRGARVRLVIEDYWRQKHIEVRPVGRACMRAYLTVCAVCVCLQAGYELIYSPHIANADLWHTSGHLEFYSEDMFRPIDVDKEKYIIKPMNCPFHCLVYKVFYFGLGWFVVYILICIWHCHLLYVYQNTPKSYRDFPLRWAELGTVYRYERSGTMHGLMRVRGFTQDDAHIFCLPEQLENEIVRVLDLVQEVLRRFGFVHFEVSLSTRPAHSVGGDDLWGAATEALAGALARHGVSYNVDAGGGAFYGPKIDIKIRDAIGRKWQCSTIQCDFNLPSRFNLEYVASDGTKKVPVMIHRAIFGSLERFFGILLESCVGEFPLFLAPEQLRILMVTDSAEALLMCQAIQEKGRREYGLRIEIDRSGERLQKQIRNAELSRVPLMAVIGKAELATAAATSERAVSVRLRSGLALEAVPSDLLLAAMRRAMDDEAGAA